MGLVHRQYVGAMMKAKKRVSGDTELLNWLKDVEQGGGPSLSLTLFNVTDVGMNALAQSPYLANVRALRLLESTNVDDAGVKALLGGSLLTNLVALNFAQTHVTDLAIETLARNQNLANLRNLNLEGTRVTDAGINGIAQSPYLSRLQTLHLGNCDVTDSAVEALAQSPHMLQLRKIRLTNTHVALPAQISQLGNALAIFQYFRESRLGGPLLEVKVPILGMGGVGKSLLLRHISGDQNVFRENNPATHAFKVRTISRNVHHAKRGHSCSARIFDFGGQTELHSAHRFFLADKRNVYIIVVSSRLTREENRLDYWLRMVKHYGGSAPVIVVVSYCDDKPGAGRTRPRDRVLPSLDAEKLSNEQNLFVQVVDGYSNINGANIEKVRWALDKAILRLEAVFAVPFAPGFFSLRNTLVGDGLSPLQNRPSFERYWTVANDFRAACESVGQKDREQQDLWLILLRDLGYVHFVGDRVKVKRRPEHSLSNYLFHPEWVKTPVYNVVRLEVARQAGGIVFGERVNLALRMRGMTDEDVRRLLALMLECELIFQVRGGKSDSPDYLIPDQIDICPRGVSLDWTGDPKRKFRWRFQFLPNHLLAQLVGRWFDEQPQGFIYFRDIIILTRRDVECRARLHADFNAHTLGVEFDQSRIDKLKARLEAELESLLDPEGVLPRPLWEEEELSFEPIDEVQVTRIAELLLVLAAKPKSAEQVKNVATVVRGLFETSNKLPDAPRLTYRICMLSAYAHVDLVYSEIEIPRPRIKEVRKILDWLNGDGVEIKKCFENDPGFKTLAKPDSFSHSYRSACRKLDMNLSQALPESLDRNARRPE